MHESHETTNSQQQTKQKHAHKIRPDTELHNTKYTQISNKTFEELVPFVLPLLKNRKAHKTRTRWYRGPFRRVINSRFFFKV